MDTKYIEGSLYNVNAMRIVRKIVWEIVARLLKEGQGSVEVGMGLSHNPEMGTSFANLQFGLPEEYAKETRHLMVTMDGKVTLLNAIRAPKWDGSPNYEMLHLKGDWAAIHAPTYR